MLLNNPQRSRKSIKTVPRAIIDRRAKQWAWELLTLYDVGFFSIYPGTSLGEGLRVKKKKKRVKQYPNKEIPFLTKTKEGIHSCKTKYKKNGTA